MSMYDPAQAAAPHPPASPVPPPLKGEGVPTARPADEPLLKVDGLSKFYGSRMGCADVSFELWPGELLAIVGEGMQGTAGLAGRMFTAISRENVNIIAIAQGSSELTIAIVVRKDGLEKAVKAVHSECRMGEQGRS